MTSDELRDKYPHLEKFWPYLDLLNEESNRGAVLISTGFLEEQLKEILTAFMIDLPQAEELIEGGNAPLGTFSARITTCYLLGLISDNEHRDLNLIRRIRNDFAHDIHTSFETENVIDRCRELTHKAHDYDSETLGEVRVDPSGQFRTAAVGLIMNLINRPHCVGKERRSAVEWPY